MQEREAVERQREELEKEKARMSSMALRLKTRTQEVEAFSEVPKWQIRSSAQRRRSVGEHEQDFPFLSPEARSREARGGLAGAAGGEAAGGRAQRPARQHPRADGAAAAAGAANPAGRRAAKFQESHSLFLQSRKRKYSTGGVVFVNAGTDEVQSRAEGNREVKSRSSDHLFTW